MLFRSVGLLVASCTIKLPFMPLSAERTPDVEVMTTGNIKPAPALATRAQSPLADHLGPEDLRRANGALALALDPQGNGSPVNWDNTESRSAGRFTPVGGPFLRDDEICRVFLTSLSTVADKHNLQGTACRPSGGEWAIKDLKPWRQPG